MLRRGLLLMKNIGIIATYSDIFGQKKTKEEIIELIKGFPLLSTFILLSQISTDSFNENELKKYYKDISLKIIEKGLHNKTIQDSVSKKINENFLEKIEIVQKNVAFSPQSVLNLWKWILAYGNKENSVFIQDKELAVSGLIHLSMMTNDYLYYRKRSNEDLYAELFSNMVFNHQENAFSSLSRTFIIYTQIAEDRNLFNNDYLDFIGDFYKRFGYTIKEYVSVIFGLYALFINPKALGERWLQNTDQVFAISKLNEISKEIISSLTVDIDTISDWSIEQIDFSWNFQKFREKPLLMVNDKEFLPFSLKLLQEQLYIGLFHKVRHIYPENDTRFLSFYGKPFEKYTQILMKESIERTKLNYEFIPEFRYKKTKDSPDIMIRLGDKLLAIEVKNYRLLLPSITEGNIDTISSDINRMVVKPLKQVFDRIQELISHDHESILGVNEIYLMVVTQGHFPTLAPYEQRINQELQSYYNNSIKGYYHLDIEEFEMLCQLVERRRPIFKVLDNKNKNKLIPFKNFLRDNTYHIKKSFFLDVQFNRAIQEMESILFNTKQTPEDMVEL